LKLCGATAIPGVTEWQGDGIQRGLTAAMKNGLQASNIMN